MSEIKNLEDLLTLEEIEIIHNSKEPEEQAIFALKRKCYMLIKENKTMKEQISTVKKIINQF